MITKAQFQEELMGIIRNGIREDVGSGDHSSLACIPEDAMGQAKLLVKEQGIIAGIDFAKMIFSELRRTRDAQEGIDAFLQKREPVWKGK